ncbi:effector-associated domain 2-containing protein, partial [Streptomyces goshikiensis]
MSVPRLPPKKVHLRLVLVEELSALDCLRDPGQRVLFGHSVGEYLERPVDMPGKDARNDTVALVHAVLREQHEVETGLDALLYAVGLHEGSDIAGRVRERVLSAWAPEASPVLSLRGPFEDEDVNAARTLLAGQNGVDRGGLLDRLAYELRLELPRDLTPAQLFDHLLDMNAQADGLPPAVVM